MSLELTMLVWSVGLAFIQMLVAVTGSTLQFGLPDLAGNLENLPPATGWASRAQHAQRNMLESLVLFAVLVLVTEIANRNDAVTGFGAQVFFWTRVIYATLFVVDVPWLRIGVWGFSTIGLILIFLQLV